MRITSIFKFRSRDLEICQKTLDFFQIEIDQTRTSTLQYYRSELDKVSFERELFREVPFANFILIGVELDEQELLEVWHVVECTR